MTVKTLGDHIHLKRLEKGFYAKELAENWGVVKSTIGLWERDVELPNEREWQSLESLLGVDSRLKSEMKTKSSLDEN